MFSRAAIFALFYLSGIAGLIYQVLWLRRLSVIFGVTVYAASTVLAAFMAGLAIGASLSGRVMRRGIAPLRAFGIAEILIGITGLLSPILLDAASAVYVALHDVAPESLGVLTIARLVCSFAILAIPTTMMGITLPLLTAAVSQHDRSADTSVSLLYAMNTLGAMSGTLLDGLHPDSRDRHSPVVHAGRRLECAGRSRGACCSSDPAVPESNQQSPIRHLKSISNRPSAICDCPSLSVVVAVSGFASLGLEIVWFRLMLQFVTATTEAFTAMLTTVLGGIALGGLVAAVILRSRRDLSAALGVAQAMTGIAALASMSFLLWTVKQGWETMDLWPAVLIAILAPSFFMGLGFPLALGIAARSAGAARSQRRWPAASAASIRSTSPARLPVRWPAGFLLLPRAGSVNSLIAPGRAVRALRRCGWCSAVAPPGAGAPRWCSRPRSS